MFLFLAAKELGDQILFRGEIAVETHLVAAGFACDGVDAHIADAVAMEKIAGSLEDSISNAHRCSLHRGRLSHFDRFGRRGHFKCSSLTCDVTVT